MTTHTELNHGPSGKDFPVVLGKLTGDAYAWTSEAADASIDFLDESCHNAFQSVLAVKNRGMADLRHNPEKFAHGMQERAAKVMNVVVPFIASVPGRELNQIRQEPVRLAKRVQDTAQEAATKLVVIGGASVAAVEVVPVVAGGLATFALMSQLNPHDAHNVARKQAIKTVVEDIANNKSSTRIKKDMDHLLQEVEITPIQNLLFKKVTR